MTPEESAKAVTDEIMDRIMSLIQINGDPIMSVGVLNPAPALIAQAIRQAEASARNEALEEAAVAAERVPPTPPPPCGISERFAWRAAMQEECATAIRSLKSKQEG